MKFSFSCKQFRILHPLHSKLHESIARHFSLTDCTTNLEKAGNDIINIITSQAMENAPIGFWMSFTSDVFQSKILVFI